MCETLGAIGPKADAAIPGITAALQDPEEKVRKCARVALLKIQRGKQP
jgi:hypothetical protein